MESTEGLFFITVLVFVGSLLLFLGGYFHMSQRRERSTVIKRIQQAGDVPTENQVDEKIRTAGNRVMTWIRSLGKLARPKDEQELSHLRKVFLVAGIRKPIAPITFFGAKVLLGIVFPALFAAFKLMIIRPIPPSYCMLIGLLLAVIGFYLPGLWLRLKVQRRKEKILVGLPEALDMMVVCVESGMGLDAAINRVGQEMALSNKVVGEEFQLLSLELRAGKQRDEALRGLAMRTDLEDVNSLVTLLIQTDRFGTSIAQALRVHSDSMRVKRQQRAEEIAAKLPVKLLLPLMVFIFPSLFVVLMGPAVIRIFRILLPTLTRG